MSAGLCCGVFLSSTGALAQSSHNWTGFYVGTHSGNAGSDNQWKGSDSGVEPFAGAFTSGGLISGFQFGYNRQLNATTVLGLEADAGLADIAGPARCTLGIYLCNARIDALGTVTARAGYAYDKFLFFGKAGGAWAKEYFTLTPTPGAGQTETLNGTKWLWGWTVGAGLEYALTPSLSAKAEYNYVSFANGGIPLSGNEGARLAVAFEQHIHLVKVGLNVKLGVNTPFERSLLSADAGGSVWNWSGFYIGVHGGGAFGTSDWNAATGPVAAVSTLTFPGSGTADGSLLGAQVGLNYQFGGWVAGAELAASWTNLDGYAKCATGAGTTSLVCRSSLSNLVTATGRLGRTYGNFLLYGLAGGAWAHEKHELYDTSGGAHLNGASNRIGFVVGSGVEYAFTPSWSGKVEYNFIDFGEETVALSDGSTVAVAQNAHLFKVGLNYTFGRDSDAARAAASSAMFVNTPLMSSGWTLEVGLRYWNSNGKSQQDLYADNNQETVNSRLIYGGLLAHSGETFFRLDHDSSRVFLKGNFGIGSITGGTLYDEDFLPAITPYSSTVHSIRDSSMRYGSLDIGYNIFEGEAGKLGPYLGYRYFYQRARGFGCDQAGPGTVCAPGGAIPGDNLALTETETYRGVAVGLNARMNVTPRWTVEVDAAYLPYVDRAGVDNHWARADINPGPETGRAWGAQVEALVSYAVTERFSVGVGGRYWYYSTLDGSAVFPPAGTSQLVKFTSDRYGAFVQASYKIGGQNLRASADDARDSAVDWTGFYAGGRLGAGAGMASWSDPFPTPVTGDDVKTGGALGGIPAGFNKQFGKIVLGAEVAGAFARIEGADTCFGGLPPTTGGFQCESTTMPVVTATGRAGYAFNRSLVYASAGAAAARINYAVNSNAAGGGTDTQTFTDWGWTVGGGIEHALAPRWSVSLDYKYVDFGSRSINFALPAVAAAATPNDVTTRMHLFTLGANYHFGAMNGR